MLAAPPNKNSPHGLRPDITNNFALPDLIHLVKLKFIFFSVLKDVHTTVSG
jgi:hypothetical protein